MYYINKAQEHQSISHYFCCEFRLIITPKIKTKICGVKEVIINV